MIRDTDGLGPHLVGKQINLNGRTLDIHQQLGEGGFSFVYLVRISGSSSSTTGNNTTTISSGPPNNGNLVNDVKQQKQRRQQALLENQSKLVLKITSVHNSTQRRICENEAKMLQALSHPSIVQTYDHGFRDDDHANKNIDESRSSNNNNDDDNIPERTSSSNSSSIMNNNGSHFAQHLILMEFCEGGTAFDAINRMKSLSSPHTTSPLSASSAVNGKNNNGLQHRFDLPSLVISFGQICNAVSYLHAQRPPIIHRDLKPVNFLIKNGAYKLCDFGSAVIGHTDLRSAEDRRNAEEVVNKTTTQMFRAPEMVDLYMTKRLTQSTDVWALGCCLYSLSFLRDCFEEGSNLAILSRKYKIPNDNPYGERIVDLIDRMLAVDYKVRADMSEVIMCLSALYSNRPLPKRKHVSKAKEDKAKPEIRRGAYRTDGQGITHTQGGGGVAALPNNIMGKKKIAGEGKKLNPNSAAAKRKNASISQKKHSDTFGSDFSPTNAATDGNFHDFASFDANFDQAFEEGGNDDAAALFVDQAAVFEGSVDDSFASTFDDKCQVNVGGPASSSQEIEVEFSSNSKTTKDGTKSSWHKKFSFS